VAVKLVFKTQPAGAGAGAHFATQPVVAAVDVDGNVASGPLRVVTLSLTGILPEAHIGLFGATTLMSTTGVFSFNELSIDREGSYTLTAECSGLTAAVSNPVAITPVEGTKLSFTSKIVGASAGSPFTAQPVVTVLDMFGNTARDEAGEVSLSLIPVTPESYDAVLSGPTKIKMVNGVASFSGLSIDKVGSYKLVAVSGSMVPNISNSFEITSGKAVKLFFNVQPVTTTAGSPLTVTPPALAVLMQDQFGNTATDASADVTITISPNTGASGAALSGVTKLKAEHGVAGFEGLSIDKGGTGYTLTATSPGLTPAVSDPFDITPPGPAAASSIASKP
jgi:hypothetical protein